MLKKIAIGLITLSVFGCTNLIMPQIPISNKIPGASFGIKSSTNLDEIRKIFLSQKVTKTTPVLPLPQSLSFNLVKNDLMRTFELNIINGPDGKPRVNRLFLKVNGKIIIDPFDFDGFDDLDFKDLKEKACKKEGIKKEHPIYKEFI